MTNVLIEEGRTAVGIELGSTRIKTVLVGEYGTPLAAGSHTWENRYEDGIWTYSLSDIWDGLQKSYGDMAFNPMHTPAVLCANHGPFAWGKDAAEAVHNAVVLEEVAKMAFRTELINPSVAPAPVCIRDKHFYRKHGDNAYYGQG